jgi:hypothetical protein
LRSVDSDELRINFGLFFQVKSRLRLRTCPGEIQELSARRENKRGQAAETMLGGNRIPAAAVALAVAAVTLMVAAVCVSPRGSELLQTVTISGQQYALVPMGSQGQKPFANQGRMMNGFANQGRMMNGYRPTFTNNRINPQLFGPGDLPMPIYDDGDYTNVIPGSNVFFYEHGVPPIPHGMSEKPNTTE